MKSGDGDDHQGPPGAGAGGAASPLPPPSADVEGSVDGEREPASDGELRLAAETARRLAERVELHNANRLATVGMVTASMVHELGTPLAVIKARAQMIAGGEVPPDELAREAQLIVQQAERMARMVSIVLDAARPASEIKANVDLSALGQQAVMMLAPLARKRSVKITFVDSEAPAIVLGDTSKLLQILSNLIINATQAMTRGGTITLTISRRPARRPDGALADHVAFDVRDEGEGIPPSILPRIFDTFFTTKRSGGGTGLGLAVSKRIAAEHNGSLEVSSEVGRGSCFTLYLPIPERAA